MKTKTKCENRLWIQSRKLPALQMAMLLLLGGTANHMVAAPGDVDLSFDPGSAVNGWVQAIAALDGGRVLIAGDFTTVHGAMRSHIARLNADGSRDDSFLAGVAGTDFPGIGSLGLQSDGKIVIGGRFTSVNDVARTNLARLNADGSLDNSFLNGLAGPNRSVGVLLQNDGKILIAGDFTTVNGSARTNLARLNADGSLDTSFLGGLAGPNGGVWFMSVQSDGKILIAGDFTLVNGVARANVARLYADGSLDDSFLHEMAGPGHPDWYSISALAVQGDGKVLVAGWFHTFNGVARTNLARLNTDGSLDQSFVANVGTEAPAMPISDLALQPDGKILIGGTLGSINGVARRGMARLNSDGTLDSSFLANLDYPWDVGVFAIALQGEDKILVGGGFYYTTATTSVRYLCRLKLDGSLDDTFNTGPTGPDAAVASVAAQPDGRLLIGGDFTSVSGVARGRVARLMPDGSRDDSFLSGLNGADRAVLALALQSDGKAVIGGDFYAVNGVVQKGIARLNADGSLDSSFTPNLEGSARAAYSLALQSDGKILLGGSFTSVNGLARTNLARLNPDGSLDSSFVVSATGSSASVHVSVLQSDGRIVIGGTFRVVNGVTRNRIARLNTDGSLDTTFLNGQSGANGTVSAIAVQSDGMILAGGGFTTFNGVARSNLARLNVNGTLDTSFLAGLTGPNSWVEGLALQSDGKILVGGGFSSFNGVARGSLARLNANGSLDSSFLNGLAGADSIRCLALLADTRIVIGGGFTVVNQVPRSYVARLMGDYTFPVIETPQSQTAETGFDVHFPAVTCSSPAYYQWFFNRTNAITGLSTNSSLELTNLQPFHCGVYTVVASNVFGAMTSAPVMLNVIPPVERRPVPGILATGESGSPVNVECADALSTAAGWLWLETLSMTSTQQYCFDVTAPVPPQRFYRAWQAGAPSVTPALNLHMIPAITLTGSVGSEVRVDGINAIGPIDAWFTLDTVTLANTSQLYFDVSVIGQPRRLYRLVPVP